MISMRGAATSEDGSSTDSDGPLAIPDSDEEPDGLLSARRDSDIGQTRASPNPTTPEASGPPAAMVDLDSSDVEY